MLSDRDILDAVIKNELVVESERYPLVAKGCSIDLHLGPKVRMFNEEKADYIDLGLPIPPGLTQEYDLEWSEYFWLAPGDLVLAATEEKVGLGYGLVGHLEGRSSLARCGLIVHGTAPRFDPGFKGHCVLELGNVGPLVLKIPVGLKICSMTFQALSSHALRPYGQPGDKYQDQEGVPESRLHQGAGDA